MENRKGNLKKKIAPSNTLSGVCFSATVFFSGFEINFLLIRRWEHKEGHGLELSQYGSQPGSGKEATWQRDLYTKCEKAQSTRECILRLWSALETKPRKRTKGKSYGFLHQNTVGYAHPTDLMTTNRDSAKG